MFPLQFKKYYERNEDIPAPIRLELCISHSGGQTTPSEPLVRYCRESVTLIFDCPLGIILLCGNRFSSNTLETCQFGVVKLSHFFISWVSLLFPHLGPFTELSATLHYKIWDKTGKGR